MAQWKRRGSNPRSAIFYKAKLLFSLVDHDFIKCGGS